MVEQAYEELSIYSNTARRGFALFVRKDIRALFQELYNKLGEVRARGCPSGSCPGHFVTEL